MIKDWVKGFVGMRVGGGIGGGGGRTPECCAVLVGSQSSRYRNSAMWW